MRILKSLPLAVFLAAFLSNLSYGVTPDRISGAIASRPTSAVAKSLHPKASLENDRGVVEPAFRLNYMTVVMKPSPTQQKALDKLLADLQDRRSPIYHQWLTPAQYADRFGVSQNDMNRVIAWLKSQGFQIVRVAAGRNAVSFSGTASQVQAAFGTEIHRFEVDGEKHIANASLAMVPPALSGVVRTVRGLHDFRYQPAARFRSRKFAPAGMRSAFFDGHFIFPNFLAPADVATIYDINPLYNASPAIDGTGQTIAIMGQTDIFLADINAFRTGFGLTQINGCTTSTTGVTGLITACDTSNFKYVLLGTDPHQPEADIGEADLDVEWSGATAPKAKIIYVNGQTANGVGDSLAFAIDTGSGPVAPIISMSYGICEAFGGDLETELQQASSEGVSVLMSSGDVGAASCDNNPPGGANANPPFSPAVGGFAVSYPASSPEVTSVGGTGISVANDTAPSAYWGNNGGATGGTSGTALQYIPETNWNDNSALGAWCATNQNIGFCNPPGAGNPGVAVTNAQTFQQDYWISIAGGGASNCYTENISGVCQAGFPQPSYQAGLTVAGAPAGVRWVPDIALFGSPNLPGYIFCTPQDPASQVYTSTCAVSISDAVDTYASIVGGTSVSTPVMAGIVALLNQYLAGPASPGLGNINPKLYSLAKTPANNAFHKVNVGDNMVYCASGQPASQPVGIRCPTTGTLVVGYSAANADATTGYNLVTGLGSVDANKLAIAWGGSRAATTVAITPSNTQINVGQSVTFTATLSSTTALGNISFFNNGSTTALGTVALTSANNGVATFSTTALPAGTDNVTASYNGDTDNKPSITGTAAVVTVIAPDFTMIASPTSNTVVAGHTSSAVTVTFTPINGMNQAITPSCTGFPTSGATCAFNPTPVPMDGTHAATTSMTISTAASMTTGANAFNISATGGGVTHTTPFTVTVNATDQSFTLAPASATYQVTQGQSVDTTVTLTAANGFNTPVTYTCTDPASESLCTGPSGATNATSVQFHITTRAPTTSKNMGKRSARFFYAALLPGLLGVLFTASSRKRSLRGLRVLGLIVALGASTVWMSACGGGGGGGGGTKDPGTPVGSYTITVNATTGGTNPQTGQTTFTLQVQ